MTASRTIAAASMAVCLGLAVGCGGGGVPAAAPNLATRDSIPAGYSLFTDAGDHFSIAVPATWRKVNPSSPGAAQAFQDVVQANPKMKSIIGNGPASPVSAGMKFFAIDPSATRGFRSNVNVAVKVALGLTDSDLGVAAEPQMFDSLQGTYQRVGAIVTDTASVSLAGHQALQIKLQIPLAQPSGNTVMATETQVFVIANDFAYIVTLAGSSPELSNIESTFSVS